MAITQRSVKVLWAGAAGRCAFPACAEKLCISNPEEVAFHTIGEMAHIRGERPGSNRHDPSQSPKERDDYKNLILLCPTHHTLIDQPENETKYGVDILITMKAEHESFVARRLESRQFSGKTDVAKFLHPLIKENHEVFINFGPFSEIAQRNPESDAHKIWLSERLTTIIPNNRRMLAVVEANTSLFTPLEQAVLASFCLHARTYDQWVNDEITYEGVRRFPTEFETLMSDLCHART